MNQITQYCNKYFVKEMADIAKEIRPYRVHLNTPLRPSPFSQLNIEEMEKIEKEFRGLNVVSVYKAKRPKAVPLDINETKRRRPLK